MPDRLRRLRRTPALRDLFAETRVHVEDLVYPIFVQEGIAEPVPIESMPGQVRWPLGNLQRLVEQVRAVGVRAVLVFGLPETKDERATSAKDPGGIIPQAVRRLKQLAPELVVMTDVCVCAYTIHGHCGVMGNGVLDQEATLPLLAEMALAHARAGADIVAPSSMVDGQVRAIREHLNANGQIETAIMAYSSKFASAFYGPFREAADSAPAFGDRRSYQHDGANLRHARRELQQDASEGADILMVKPGLPYLDVVREARETTDHPIAVYNVSGEYAMVKAAAERGWIDEHAVVMETMISFRRAGADLILTYHALDVAAWLSGAPRPSGGEGLG